MRGTTTTARGPVPRRCEMRSRRPSGRRDSQKRWTRQRGPLRVTKTDPTGTSTYLYDGGDLLEELTTAPTGGDAVETTAGGTVLNRITATGTAYLHPDANANIGEVTNPNGTLQTRHAYAPWGNHTTTNTGSATDPYRNRHTFAGATGVRDDNGGLTDMRNRMYDPTLGTFISRDPLENSTHDPYRYAGGNPVSRLDPYGLDDCGDTDSISGFLGGLVDCASKVSPVEGQTAANFAGGTLNGLTLGNADTLLGAVDAITPLHNSVDRVRWNAPETAIGNVTGMALLAPIAVGSPAAFGTYSNITAGVDLAGEVYSCVFTNCSPVELGSAVMANVFNYGAFRIGQAAGDELGQYANIFFTYLWGGASSTFGLFAPGSGAGTAK
jgi:RHS repeat-associated protein